MLYRLAQSGLLPPEFNTYSQSQVPCGGWPLSVSCCCGDQVLMNLPLGIQNRLAQETGREAADWIGESSVRH